MTFTVHKTNPGIVCCHSDAGGRRQNRILKNVLNKAKATVVTLKAGQSLAIVDFCMYRIPVISQSGHFYVYVSQYQCECLTLNDLTNQSVFYFPPP